MGSDPTTRTLRTNEQTIRSPILSIQLASSRLKLLTLTVSLKLRLRMSEVRVRLKLTSSGLVISGMTSYAC